MLSEYRNVFHFLGLKKMIANARDFKEARASIRGYGLTSVYWALLEVGFIEQLEQSEEISPTEFSREFGVDESLLESFVRYLVRLKHLRVEKSGGVSFTRCGKRHWDRVKGVMNIFCAYEPYFNQLEPLLKKERLLKDIIRRDQRVAVGFRETGASFTFDIIEQIMRELEVTGIVELGCGNIDLSLFISRRRPELSFLGIDYDERFLAEARQTIEQEKLSGRVQLLDCDIFELTAESHDFSPYNLVTAVDLFHGYFFKGRERVVSLFRTLRTTFPDKNFLISEMCLADEAKMKNIAYPMVEHELFHDLTGQKTFKAGELEGLLEEAGFSIRQIWPVRNLGARLFILFE